MPVQSDTKHPLKSEFPALEACTLFEGISEENLCSILACLNPTRVECKKGDNLFNSDSRQSNVGIVLKGSINIVRDDVWGNRSLIDHILPGCMFGEVFIREDRGGLNLSAIAADNSVVMLIDHQRIMCSCSENCVFHVLLIKNMIISLVDKNIALTRKIEHLSKKTLEEKIRSYLSSQVKLNDSIEFDIPFTRTELADYLSADRASLSRTLSKMQEKGLIRFSGNHFEVLDGVLFEW